MRRALAIGALVALAAVSVPAPARSSVERDALLLARIVVSESGWRGYETGDAHAIAYTIAGTAHERGMSFAASARVHSPRATGRRATSDARLAWVSGLREDGMQPAAWPPVPHAPWAAYRARWLDVLERSREAVTWSLEDHERDSLCSMPPVTWAARWHEPSPGLREIDCGDTHNAFYTTSRAR